MLNFPQIQFFSTVAFLFFRFLPIEASTSIFKQRLFTKLFSLRVEFGREDFFFKQFQMAFRGTSFEKTHSNEKMKILARTQVQLAKCVSHFTGGARRFSHKKAKAFAKQI